MEHTQNLKPNIPYKVRTPKPSELKSISNVFSLKGPEEMVLFDALKFPPILPLISNFKALMVFFLLKFLEQSKIKRTNFLFYKQS